MVDLVEALCYKAGTKVKGSSPDEVIDIFFNLPNPPGRNRVYSASNRN
jgi:hypothetical protein